jgi:hypothetical protein
MLLGKLVRWFTFGSIACVATSVLFALEAGTPPPAFVVLDAGKASAAKTATGQIPTGWQLKVNAGQSDITQGDQSDNAALHFRSAGSSYGLERAVDIDPSQAPYLTWRWKVTQLPKGGDFRHRSTDDQAAQVIVAFADHRIISYIWDSTAPEGTMENASSIPLVHIYAIVCRSGGADLNRWLQETRDVAADYEKAFGKSAPRVKGVRLQINSQHTGSSAESYFGDVVFRNTQA